MVYFRAIPPFRLLGQNFFLYGFHKQIGLFWRFHNPSSLVKRLDITFVVYITVKRTRTTCECVRRALAAIFDKRRRSEGDRNIFFEGCECVAESFFETEGSI